MAYEARRDIDDEELDKKAENAKSDANNARLVRAGLEIADKVPLDPETAAIVKGIKAADDATGGLVSKVGGKALTLQSKVNPLAGLQQKALNKVADSGALDAAEKAKSVYDKAHGDVKKPETPNQVKTPANSGGEQNGSLPSSGDKNNLPEKKGNEDLKNKQNVPTSDAGHENKDKSDDKDKDTDKDKKTDFGLFGIHGLTPVLFLLLPLLVTLMLVFLVVTVVANFADYEDAFGISQLTGGNTGGMDGTVTDPIQSAFYERIVEVRTEFQNDGKTFDPLLIVSVYHSLDLYGADISYNGMTKYKITQIANAMFEENSNVYNENIFRENLKNDIIPTYIPNAGDDLKEKIVNEVFDYIERYYALIGQTSNSSNCSSVGTCTYNINGFYIQGKGNVAKNLNINDLYVRLMQCGSSSGHNYGGTYGQPLAGEDLVPFEKYILGVAYAEIGPGAPEHAFKAQMIAARSFILARPTDMGGWRTLQQEADGKWVIQVASCTADQVYCDPDKGCSTAAGGNGQWSQVHSGTSSGRVIKGPIDEASPLRQYAADVQGEVLVNNQGNVISAGYLAAESNQFTSLARNGYDYKQILLQVYNQGNRNYGATDIYKASCGNCTSSGEYASWKQYEGEWIGVNVGTSGKTIKQIGCLATSIAIQIARSGVATNINGEFNPGTFVEYLNNHGGFYGGNLNWNGVTNAAPSFVYQDRIYFDGYTKEQKLNAIREIVSQSGVYAVCEVKGNTGQHWVAIDSVNGNTINMMDPGSSATDMWSEYNWQNTSQIVYYRVS